MIVQMRVSLGLTRRAAHCPPPGAARFFYLWATAESAAVQAAEMGQLDQSPIAGNPQQAEAAAGKLQKDAMVDQKEAFALQNLWLAMFMHLIVRAAVELFPRQWRPGNKRFEIRGRFEQRVATTLGASLVQRLCKYLARFA
jgi:hypothetical protein